MPDILGGIGSTVQGIVRQQAQNTLGNALSKYSIGGVNLGSLFPFNGPASSDWRGDLLSEANFRVRFSLDPGVPQAFVRSVSVSLPSLTYDKRREAGVDRYYINGSIIQDMTVGFNEDSYATVLQLYRSFQKRAYEEATGLYGVKVEYEQVITVDIVDSSGSPLLTIDHIGCVPVRLSSYEMSVAGAKAILPSITFKVEEVKISGSGFGSETSILESIMSGVKDRIVDEARSAISGAIFSVL